MKNVNSQVKDAEYYYEIGEFFPVKILIHFNYFFSLAYIYYDHKQYEEAIKNLNKSIEFDNKLK